MPTKDQVKQWFDGTTNNIAIVTGSVSRLIVFHIDSGSRLNLMLMM